MWSLGALPDGEYVKYVLTRVKKLLTTATIIDMTEVIMILYGSTTLIHNYLFHLFALTYILPIAYLQLTDANRM